jgi:hypothetical protein
VARPRFDAHDIREAVESEIVILRVLVHTHQLVLIEEVTQRALVVGGE